MDHTQQTARLHMAGQKIRRWREERNLSAGELGERLNPAHATPVPPHTIYNWELRGKVARPKHQRRLAELGICLADDWLRPAVREIEPEPEAGTA